MPKAIIHIGAPKTATSSIQDFCLSQRDYLASHGLVFPFFDLNDKRISNHTGIFRSAFSTFSPHQRSNVDKPTSVAWLSQLLSTGSDLLFSGEGISSFKADEFECMRIFFESRGYEVDFKFFLRMPYSFHCSAIQQIIKSGRYVNLKRKKFFLTKKVEGLFAVGVKACDIFSFEKSLSHQDGIIGFFVDKCLGLDRAGLQVSQMNVKSNQSLTNVQIRALNQLNADFGSGGKKEDSGYKFRFSRREILNCQESNACKFLLTEAEFGFLKDHFKAEIQGLKALLPEVNTFSEKIATSEEFDCERFMQDIYSRFRQKQD